MSKRERRRAPAAAVVVGVAATIFGIELKKLIVSLIACVLALCASATWALPGTFMIDEIYSNVDGTVQFVEIRDHGQTDCDAQENLWAGQTLLALGPAPVRTFVFPSNLPTCATSRKRILIATQSFAALGLVAPDYVIPDGFIQIPDGGLTFADISHVSYTNLPTDGVHAINGVGATVDNLATNLAGNSASVVPSSGPAIDQQGMTGSWYEAVESGQGFEIEIYPDLIASGTGLLQGAWFTFERGPAGGADHQRWYTFNGRAQSGAANVPVTIFENLGGNFNAPPVTNAAAVGTGALSFDSCTSGSLTYTFTDGSGRSGSIPMTRITPNVTCTAAAAKATNADFGLSGNWFDPTTSGQGFVFEVNPLVPVVFFAWYTYAPAAQALGAAGQRWFTGQGKFTPGTHSAPLTLYETTGGVFDTPTAMTQASVAVGSATVTFTSCMSGQLTFNFMSGSNAGHAGTITLSRVGPVPAGCAL